MVIRGAGGPLSFLAERMRSERRIVEVNVVVFDGALLDLIAIFLLQLQGVAPPDRVSQFVEEFKDGQGLLWGPVGGIWNGMVFRFLLPGSVMTWPCDVGVFAVRIVRWLP